MANYYTDQPEIAFHLEHPLMKRIVELKERNYADKDKYEEAPVNYEDAIENYKRILDITGEVAANIIEPNSESVPNFLPYKAKQPTSAATTLPTQPKPPKPCARAQRSIRHWQSCKSITVRL